MTNRELQSWVVDATRTDYERAAAKIAQRYKKAEEEILKDIQSAYRQHLRGMKPGDHYNIIIKFDRLASLLNDVRANYLLYARAANADIVTSSTIGITNAYYRKQYQMSWLHDKAIRFTVLDPRIVEVSVLGTDKSWKAITQSLQDRYMETGQMARQLGSLSEKLQMNAVENLDEIEQIITTNLRRGTGIRRMTSEIQDAMDNDAWQALRIAQTESTRTMNTGQQLSSIDARNAGVKIKRMWMITNTNTRSNHKALNKTLAEVDKPWKNGPMRPGAWGAAKDDINEHCWVFDSVINADGEPQGPQLRRGRNPVTGKNEVMTQSQYDDWQEQNDLRVNAKGITVPRQKRIK